MPITAGNKNPFGSAHAGAMLWLADVAATMLVWGLGEATEVMKGFPLSITFNANLLDNQSKGSSKVIVSFVKRGRTVSVVRTLSYGAGGG